MDSALISFLKSEFSSFYKASDSTEIRKEEHPSGRFEIRDKRETIIQYKGKGVSVIRNNSQIPVEIIDFEGFMNNSLSSLGVMKCDFIINPIAGYEFIILNELTESETRYISDFVQPQTGISREGKLSYARRQLLDTINLFYGVSDFFDRYSKKVALFSCRLSDAEGNSVIKKSIKAFRKPMAMFANIRSLDPLPHGFIFEQRIYDREYKTSE